MFNVQNIILQMQTFHTPIDLSALPSKSVYNSQRYIFQVGVASPKSATFPSKS